jgi:prepilin-type N-terminal cleavage/methylation domain-containing protein
MFPPTAGARFARGFTLLEILIGLSILGCSLVVIMGNVNHAVLMYRVARETAVATTIASARMQRVLAQGDGLRTTEENGVAEEDRRFRYKVSVTDANLPGFEVRDLNGLFKVDVTVSWDGGVRDVHLVQLATNAPSGEPNR